MILAMETPPAMSSPPPWPTPPLMSGRWHDLDADLTAALRDRLVGTEVRCRPLVYAGRMLAYRAKPLAFWPKWLWIDALLDTKQGPAAGAFLYGPYGALPLDGTSEIIHDINEVGFLELKSTEVVADYLRFFCCAVRGDEGPFHLIEDAARFRELTGGDEPSALAAAGPKPLAIAPAGSGWRAEALVVYGTGLYRSTFAISEDGIIEMVDDEPLASDLRPVNIEFDGLLSRPRQGAAR